MEDNKLTVLTLDAGGTNLVFSAVQNNKILEKKVHLPAPSETLEEFLMKTVSGFSQLQEKTGTKADAISFCFPGPADYEEGIIGDLENLPFFRGGVPLGKILENEFHIPVYINNDGDLFTLGEAIGGFLKEVNAKSRKKYKNLLGVTLGTGFGGGLVSGGRLFHGDNSAAAEINRFSGFFNRSESAEEVLSIRGIRRLFAEAAGISFEKTPEPFDIYRIGTGEKEGDRFAAVAAWERFGRALGDALANAVSLTDSCVVIGGGLSGAQQLFLPAAIKQMNGFLQKKDGSRVPRMEVTAFNWEDSADKEKFLADDTVILKVPFSEDTQVYSPVKKIAAGISCLGTSDAVALGAYAFAKNRLARS
jgi:glucokinase